MGGYGFGGVVDGGEPTVGSALAEATIRGCTECAMPPPRQDVNGGILVMHHRRGLPIGFPCDAAQMGTGGGPRRRRGSGRRLYTATLGLVADRSILLVFHASLASNSAAIRHRMIGRVGEFGAAMARIRRGYDAADLIARTIVTPRLVEILEEVEADPTCAVARGFYVHHVERVGLIP